MRTRRSRIGDSSFELNLAPFLDIIVSIVPMLLLSVAFIQIKMIETSVPQVVANKIEQQRKEKTPQVALTLKASKKSGYTMLVNQSGRVNKTHLPLSAKGELDYEALTALAIQLKLKHVDVFRVDFEPRDDISYDEIVMTMDSLRRLPAGQKVAVKDDKTGESAQTDLMFPDVIFANVVEGS